LGLRTEGEGIFSGAAEAIAAGDLLGQGADEALAIDRDGEGGMDAGEEVGDVEGGAGLLEYVIRYIDLRQT